jgi:hypothetical protein
MPAVLLFCVATSTTSTANTPAAGATLMPAQPDPHTVQRLSHQSTISFFIRTLAFLDTYRPSRQRESSSVHKFLTRRKPHICSFVSHEDILLLKTLAYIFYTTASA